MEVCGLVHAPAASSPVRVLGTHWPQGWFGPPEAVSKLWREKQSLFPLPEIEPWFLAAQMGNIEVVTQPNFLHGKSHSYRARTEPTSPKVIRQFVTAWADTRPIYKWRVPERSLDGAVTIVGNVHYFKGEVSTANNGPSPSRPN